MQSNEQKQKLKRFWRQRFVVAFGCLALVGMATTQVPFLQEQLSLQEKLQRIEALDEKQQAFQRLSKKLQELQKDPNLDIHQYIQDHRGRLNEAKAAVTLLEQVRSRSESLVKKPSQAKVLGELAATYGYVEDATTAVALQHKVLNLVASDINAIAFSGAVNPILLLELGDEEATVVLLQQLFRQVRKFPEDALTMRGLVFGELSTSYGRFREEKALQQLRGKILSQVKNLPEEYDSYKVESLIAIASAYGQSGSTKEASMLLEQALRESENSINVAMNVTYGYPRSYNAVLPRIASIYEQIGDTKLASSLFERSMQQALKISSGRSKENAYLKLASAHIQAGNPKKGIKLLEQLLEWSETYASDRRKSDRYSVLLNVVRVSGPLEDGQLRLMLLKQVLQHATELSHAGDQGEVIYAISTEAAQLGAEGAIVPLLKQVLKQHQDINLSYGDDEYTALPSILTQTAKAIGKIENRTAAVMLLRQAHKQVERVTEYDSYYQIELLIAISSAFQQLGEEETAVLLLQQVLEDYQGDALKPVAEALGQWGDKKTGRMFLEEILKQAENISEAEKIDLFASVASAYGQLGDMKTAMLLSAPVLQGQQPDALMTIVAAYQQQGDLQELAVIHRLSELLQIPNLQDETRSRPEGLLFEQAVFSLLLPCFFAIMLLYMLAQMHNPVSLSVTGQLIIALPEECVAELETLKQRMTLEQRPKHIIQLRMAQETLELLWAFYIQIRLDNFRLPQKEKKIDD